jgi:esterase/lipase
MTILKTILKIFLGAIVLLTAVFFLGPRPAKPTFPIPTFENMISLSTLERSIAESEKKVIGIKPENEAKIIWADTTKKEKTKIALMYLHGFGASHHEGYPVHTDIAKHFGCNIFLARLAEHGIENGDNNMLNFTAEEYVASAERAYNVARQLGDSVVILATSGGGAMALFLASRHPEIKGLVTYSPAIRIFKKEAALMSGPWGLQLSHWITGKKHNEWVFKNAKQRYYWTNHQRFEGVIQFAVFLKYTMLKETFEKVKCPFFMAYYYQNEEKQDKTVSVVAMHEMYAQLGTPPQLKREKAFPKADAHVITSNLTTDEWQAVEQESIKFMEEVLNMRPVLKKMPVEMVK